MTLYWDEEQQPYWEPHVLPWFGGEPNDVHQWIYCNVTTGRNTYTLQLIEILKKLEIYE